MNQEFEWLIFLSQLPTTPSSLRVGVWRKLRAAGAAGLQNGVWVLPRTEEHERFMERLLLYVKQQEASGQVFVVQALNQATCQDVLARFQADRNEEYAEFLEQSEIVLAEIRKETDRQKFSFAELEENEQNLQRLSKWLAKIWKRDFFEAEKRQAALHALEDCRQALQGFATQVYARAGLEVPAGADLLMDEPLLDRESDDDGK